MRERRFVRRRRFRRKSNRELSTSDLAVLDFIWTRRVASTAILKKVAHRNKSDWWVYRAVRHLEAEGYIVRFPRGKFLELELWALTEPASKIVLMDRDDDTRNGNLLVVPEEAALVERPGAFILICNPDLFRLKAL